MQPSSASSKASSTTRDFSLRFEMTAGGEGMAFALSGRMRFFAVLRNDMGGKSKWQGEKDRNDYKEEVVYSFTEIGRNWDRQQG